ncbi:MAG TPA: hypothetical protein VG432_00075 [Gemmatimonadaceae bacterium]|nr:hypothetical protein [Gemmatimonadaceae bacterium]
MRATVIDGLAIDVVIFAPALERRLLAGPGGEQLRGRVRFTRRVPWVRHDEHYHVNFRVLPDSSPRSAAGMPGPR